MNLVRWFRKNNRKVMAVVIIVILFGFIGGSTLLQYLDRKKGGLHKTIAYFGDGKKITNYDLVLARQELAILNMLGVDGMLKNIVFQALRTPDLQALLLGELLFSDRMTSPGLIQRIKQTIRMDKYRVSNKQIDAIYTESVPDDIRWLLLEKEARQAGVRISNENSGKLLTSVISRLFPGATYSQLIGAMIRGMRGQPGIPEEKILATFGKLMAVLEYAKMVCSGENVTTAQIMHNVSWENETIDVEFVEFSSAVFAETQAQPSEQEISEHFYKYKKFFAGAVSEQNPYGFGYKLPDRVKLEYIAVKLDDISSIVAAPTQEETEEYYQKYREQFTKQVPSDPNDPNSPLTEQIRSYAEMAESISKSLLLERINSKAEQILQESKRLAETGFEGIDTEPADIDAEQYRLASMAADYETIAERLSKKHKTKVYAGQTGMLNANDMRADEYLGRLYLVGYGYNTVGLAHIVFAIDELGASELGPFDVAKPRMYENIGPMKDMLWQITGDISGQIMAVVRVIGAQKPSEPESANQTFSKNTFRFEQDEEQVSEDIYSVREKVVEDLKKLAAMDITKSKAEEFIDLAARDGWEGAIEKFNELYGRQDERDEGDPNVFRLQKLTSLPRISRETIETLVVQSAGDPAAQLRIDSLRKEALLRDKFYSLVPQDANTVEAVPLIVEFKPNMSCYCLKNVSVKRISQDEYEKIKAIQVYREDFVQLQSLAAVHFNPGNILKRMNYRPTGQEERAADTNTPAESMGTL